MIELLASTEMYLVLRASSLTDYPECPRRFAARALTKFVEGAGYQLRHIPSGIGAVVGSSVHRGIGFGLAEKAATGRLAPMDACEDASMATLKEELGKGDLITDDVTPNPMAAEMQIRRMVKAYMYTLGTTVQPIMVERRLEALALPGIILSGQQDQLAREPNAIRDLKTGRMRGKYKPQLGAYSLLARTHGETVDKVFEDYLPRVTPKKPQPMPVSYEHDIVGAEGAAISIMKHVAMDLTLFREGDPDRGFVPGDPWAFPANPNSKLCSERWCPAWGTAWCREHAEAK